MSTFGGEKWVRGFAEARGVWRNQGGMALLITVMILSLLVGITVQYHKTTWSKFVVSHNHKVGTQLKMLARSGVEIAFALLEQDGKANSIDSWHDSWATLGDHILDDLFPAGSLRLEITDLTGRLQINSLVRKKNDGKQMGDSDAVTTETEARSVLLRLLLSGSMPIEGESQARQIVDAIVDWIDEDDRESDYGAEKSYYRSLDVPYECRNGPIQYIEELLLVRGVTPGLLFGSAKNKGLADYLTVFGNDGKININTAPPLIIKSLDQQIDDELVARLDEFRKAEDNAENLGDPSWYRNVGGWPEDVVMPAKMLTTKSSFFLITAAGRFDTLVKRQITVAQRSSNGQVTMLWKKVE